MIPVIKEIQERLKSISQEYILNAVIKIKDISGFKELISEIVSNVAQSVSDRTERDKYPENIKSNKIIQDNTSTPGSNAVEDFLENAKYDRYAEALQYDEKLRASTQLMLIAAGGLIALFTGGAGVASVAGPEATAASGAAKIDVFGGMSKGNLVSIVAGGPLSQSLGKVLNPEGADEKEFYTRTSKYFQTKKNAREIEENGYLDNPDVIAYDTMGSNKFGMRTRTERLSDFETLHNQSFAEESVKKVKEREKSIEDISWDNEERLNASTNARKILNEWEDTEKDFKDKRINRGEYIKRQAGFKRDLNEELGEYGRNFTYTDFNRAKKAYEEFEDQLGKSLYKETDMATRQLDETKFIKDYYNESQSFTEKNMTRDKIPDQSHAIIDDTVPAESKVDISENWNQIYTMTDEEIRNRVQKVYFDTMLEALDSLNTEGTVSNLEDVQTYIPDMTGFETKSEAIETIKNNMIELYENTGKTKFELWELKSTIESIPQEKKIEVTLQYKGSIWNWPHENTKKNDGENQPVEYTKPAEQANGGFITSPLLSWVGEDGPEAIIPLGSKRRSRGLSLWRQTGEMLGIPAFADGVITNDGGLFSDTGLPAYLYGSSDTGFTDNSGEETGQPAVSVPVEQKTSSVQVAVSAAPVININGVRKDDDIVSTIRSHIRELADDMCGEIADKITVVFSNMPKEA